MDQGIDQGMEEVMLESVGKEPSKVKVLDQEEDEGENVLQVQHGIPVETQSESSSDNSESENFEDDSLGYSLLPQEDPISDSDKMEAEREPQKCPPTVTVVINDETSSNSAHTDKDQSDLILKAMSGFNLPSSATPEWAKVVPEDVWKEEILSKIRTNH